MATSAKTPRAKTIWDCLDLPISFGLEPCLPAFMLGRIICLAIPLPAVLIGVAMDYAGTHVPAESLFSLLAFIVAIFLALVSLVGIFSVFIYERLKERRSAFVDRLWDVAKTLRVDIQKMNIEVSAKHHDVLFRARNPANESRIRQWVSLHQSLRVEVALSDMMRLKFERLLLITIALVIPSLAALPIAPLAVIVNPISVGLILFTTIFAIWATWESAVFIGTCLNVIHEKLIVLDSVRLPDGHRIVLVQTIWREKPPR